MTNPETIAKLIGDLEALTGPYREIDKRIELLTNTHLYGDGACWINGDKLEAQAVDMSYNILVPLPEYTASVDACLALVERVLPGCLMAIITKGKYANVNIVGPWETNKTDATMPVTRYEGGTDLKEYLTAIALCIATLKALLAQEEG